MNESAPPGKELKYARVERERRFLLAELPSQPSIRDVQITDRYLIGTRLRLREAIETNPKPGDVQYKLTQKIPDPAGRPGLITTLYLSEAEYQVLTALPARILRKVRHSIPPFGVDAFEGALLGLYLAEAEFTTDAESAEFSPPAFAIAEVTSDPRFTGGYFVTTDREDVNGAMAEFGLTLLQAAEQPKRAI